MPRALGTRYPPGQLSSGRISGWNVVRCALGVLLLAAAGLKAYGRSIDPVSQDSFLGSPRFFLASIELELILGLWLLSGRSARSARAAAAGFFTVLAGVSLYLALSGQRSCGCFGPVTVSPWLSFVLDLAAVAALLVWPPPRTRGDHPAAWFRHLLKTGAGAATLLALAGGAFLCSSANGPEALLWLRGESITVEPTESQVSDGVIGERRAFLIQLRNHRDRAVRIIGGTTTCPCIATADLPITVLPGQSRSIEVQVRFQGEQGRFRHSFVLYTDDERQPVVTAWFAGRVMRRPHRAEETN